MSTRLDQLLSAEDVAGLFQIKVRLLYDQRYRSEPPGALGITVGGRVRWDPADVRAYIDQQKQKRPPTGKSAGRFDDRPHREVRSYEP
jgi:predicted DNA-binding transcriptional regulator AlpA